MPVWQRFNIMPNRPGIGELQFFSFRIKNFSEWGDKRYRLNCAESEWCFKDWGIGKA